MHFQRRVTFELWIVVLMFIAYTVASDDGSKTVTLGIGFELTHDEKNGDPVLRILNANDASAENGRRRALNEGSSSSSSSSEENKKKEKAPQDASIKPRVEDSDTSSDSDAGSGRAGDDPKPKSTKGIKREDYEPEENVRVHGKQVSSDVGSAASTSRFPMTGRFFLSEWEMHYAYPPA